MKKNFLKTVCYLAINALLALAEKKTGLYGLGFAFCVALVFCRENPVLSVVPYALANALVHFDLEALAYILTHELVHLWELNHSPSFYARLDRYYPNWRELKRYLGCPIQKALPLYGERQLPDSLYAALGIAPGASSRPAGSSSEAQRLLA